MKPELREFDEFFDNGYGMPTVRIRPLRTSAARFMQLQKELTDAESSLINADVDVVEVRDRNSLSEADLLNASSPLERFKATADLRKSELGLAQAGYHVQQAQKAILITELQNEAAEHILYSWVGNLIMGHTAK